MGVGKEKTEGGTRLEKVERGGTGQAWGDSASGPEETSKYEERMHLEKGALATSWGKKLEKNGRIKG